jgi:hypothetical protein
MKILRTVKKNLYLRLVILFALCYIVQNAFSVDRFDFIIILYVLHLEFVNENDAINTAFTFGLFYDLEYQFCLGFGVLLFLLLNFIKIGGSQFFDSNSFFPKLFLSVAVMIVYILSTLLVAGFPFASYWQSFAYYFMVNFIAVFIVWIFQILFGSRYAISTP